MPSEKSDVVPGTLDMLILKTLSLESMHGYGIAQNIQRLSGDVLEVEEGSLYPALQRLRARGLVVAEWKMSPTKRRARYYRLTRAGRTQLGDVETAFTRATRAIARVLRATEV